MARKIQITNRSASIITVIEDDTAPYGLLPNTTLKSKASKIILLMQYVPCSIEIDTEVPGEDNGGQ